MKPDKLKLSLATSSPSAASGMNDGVVGGDKQQASSVTQKISKQMAI